MGTVGKTGIGSTSRSGSVKSTEDTPKSKEVEKKELPAQSSEPAATKVLSTEQKAQAAAQKQHSGLMKRASIDGALQAKYGTKYEKTEAKREQYGEAKGKLKEAHKETEKARTELKSLDTMGTRLGELKTKRDEAKARLDASREQQPGESDSAFQTRKTLQDKMKLFTGKTEEESDYEFHKGNYDALKEKAYAGKAPLKEHLKDLKGKEKEAKKEFKDARHEFKSELKSLSTTQRKVATSSSQEMRLQADELRRKADKIEAEVGPDKIVLPQQHDYTKKHKGKSEKVHVMDPSKVVPRHFTESEKLYRKEALAEARSLRDRAAELELQASQTHSSRWVKEELKDVRTEQKEQKKH